jgi:hypothetical protein
VAKSLARSPLPDPTSRALSKRLGSCRRSHWEGELVGGLAAWSWGGLCGIELLWVRDDSRKDRWGSRILPAAADVHSFKSLVAKGRSGQS